MSSPRMTTSAMMALLSLFVSMTITAVASGPQLDSFDGQSELQSSIDTFHTWFYRHYEYFTSKSKVPADLQMRPPVEIRLAKDASMRMGVYATADIPLDSPYIPIPLGMVLSRETALAPPISPFHQKRAPSSLRVAEVLRGLLQSGLNRSPIRSANAVLALALLHEAYVVREESFFAPYIRLLPATHDTPQFYTPEELHLVRGTEIPRLVRDRNASHQSQYQWMKSNVFSVHPDLWPMAALPGSRPLSGPLSRRRRVASSSSSSQQQGGAGSYEAWLWVSGILDTRMIWWDNEPHLVPMLDMINCGELRDPHRIHSTFRKDQHALTLAPQKFKTGEQIFENYGQPNPTYMMYHGFTMVDNIHDCGNVYVDIPKELSFLPSGAKSKTKSSSIHRLGFKDTVCVAKNSKMSHSLRAMGGIQELIALGRVASSTDDTAIERYTRSSVREALDMKRALDRKAVVFAGKLLNRTLAGMASEEELELPTPLGPLVTSTTNEEGDPTFFRAQMIRTFVKQQRSHIIDSIAFLKSRIKKSSTKTKGAPITKKTTNDEL